MPTTLVTKHNAGFFSCCSVRLHDIVAYYNKNKQLPDIVDSSVQFKWYKIEKDNDITLRYFDDYNNYKRINYINRIDYCHEHQYKDYSTIDFNILTPLIEKYFSPSKQIQQLIKDIKDKYVLEYDNICVLFYRGNDKNRETKICGYDEYLTYAYTVLTKNPNTVFLIQSDETEFIEYMTHYFPNNSLYFKDEIRHIKKCDKTVDHCVKSDIKKYSMYYLAITIIMSKCKYIICGTGNCSIWIMLYRGNNINVYQNNNNSWLKVKTNE